MGIIFRFFLWAISSFAVDEKVLVLGDEMTLHGNGRLWIGASAILSARERGAAIRLKGRKEGLSEARFGKRELLVRVVSPRAARTFRQLKRSSASLAGLDARWEGTKVIVAGRLHSIEDFRTLSKSLPLDAIWEMHAAIPARLQIALEKMLLKEVGPEAPIHPLLYEPGPTALFSGTVEKSRHWSDRLARWGIVVRRDDSAVEMAPTVRVEIALAEIRRDRARTVGLGWPTAAEAKLLPDGKWTRGDLLFNARAFESEGLGKLLARPNILCRSGKEAEFVAGGEFPIKIFNHRLQDVIWKRYGIVLRVKPKADASGRISLALETEVSSVDSSRTVDGIPGLLTNKVASHFDLSRPRTIVLSGLLKSEDAVHREGLPGLSAIPVLGALFGSRDWRENRSELVVFVRPSIVREDDR